MVFHTTRASELGTEKRCRCCGEFWPADGEFFHPMRSSKDGLSQRCIACIKAGLWHFPRSSPVAFALGNALGSPRKLWCTTLFATRS